MKHVGVLPIPLVVEDPVSQQGGKMSQRGQSPGQSIATSRQNAVVVYVEKKEFPVTSPEESSRNGVTSQPLMRRNQGLALMGASLLHVTWVVQILLLAVDICLQRGDSQDKNRRTSVAQLWPLQ